MTGAAQALLIGRLDLRRRLRDRSILVQVFLAPIVLALIVGGAFGGGSGGLSATIAIADADATAASAQPDTIGSVDTVFKFIGPDHKIVVEAYDDPLVKGVTCYVSRARTGGGSSIASQGRGSAGSVGGARSAASMPE